MSNKIRIFSDTKTGLVTFDGSTVSDKEIGSVEALAHPTQSERIIIKSTRIFKRGSSTEYRVFLKRLKASRVQNEAAETLTEAPYNYTRDQVVDYLNVEFSTPIIQEYFEYNPATDRLVAQRDIQVNKNGFFLGEKHKMASGGSNIYFEDLDNNANSYPVFGEVLDQSLSANQQPGAGVTLPKTRVFQDFNPVPLGGNPVADTAIPYDGDNFFPFNISGQGITTRAGETLSADQQLKYEIVVNGISVYVQYLQPGALAVNDPITWYFDQPLDIEAGTTLRATIYKISIQNNQEVIDGIFNVNEGDAVPTRYQTQVLARLFTDKDIALKEDVDQLLNGSIYKGAYDASGTGTPALPTGSDVLGDFYRVTTPNALSGYNTGDILVFNGTDYDHVAESSATQSDIKNSALRIYDIYVKAGYAGSVKDGSVLYPYDSIETAIASANDGDQIYLEGSFEISGEITIPSTKSLFFYGSDDAAISFTNYADTNAGLIKFTGTDNSKEFKFVNITFKNAGDYALDITKAAKVEIDDCEFINNGWNGAALNTVLPSTTTALLGYDSTDTDLQAFFAGANASDGGAVSLTEVTQAVITGNTVTKNFRGLTLVDCGVGGAGVITRNQITQNIDAGINLTAGATHSGSQNITTSMNVVAYNAGNGLQVVGGLNNKFSQNEVNGNWNAGFYAAGAGNATLRDCGLYDNNRSAYSGRGLTGAKASIVLDESANLLGNTISLNAAARFIAEILDTQVHYTGLGSNTEKLGLHITAAVGNLNDDPKNIIKVDDVGFIGQDYAIDLSEVDVSNLRLALGDNSYQSIGTAAVKPPLAGNYNELPFSNHVTSIPSVNVEVDVLNQSVKLKEYVSGNVINVYAINELVAVDNGNTADILQKDSDKIQLRGLTLGNVYINGVAAGNTVNSMVNTLNAAFDMTLIEYNDFLRSEVGLNGDPETGGILPARADDWYIAYGALSGTQLTSPGITQDIKDKQPFYAGNLLDKGREFTFTHDNTGNYMIGVWSGAESETLESNVLNSVNWSAAFRFVRSANRISGSASVGVDTLTRLTAGDNDNVVADGHYNVVNNSTLLSLRFGNDGYLYLVDITNSANFVIGRSNSPIIGDQIAVYFGGENQPNAKLPVIQERTETWTMVHDRDLSEGAEWADGIEVETVLKSNMEIYPGQKVTLNFNYFGRDETIGLGYTLSSSNVANAQDQVTYALEYTPSEIIKQFGSTNWSFLTGSNYYNSFNNGYQVGNGVNLGLISFRYNEDNTVELWHETNNEQIADLNSPLDGNPFSIYIGASEAMPASRIPELLRFALSGDTTNQQTWYYIESPDGNFTYPLFASESEAFTVDLSLSGNGTAVGYTFPDEPTNTTWYGPTSGFVNNATTAPTHGAYGSNVNVIWNEIPQDDDSAGAPTPFSAQTVSIDELDSLNQQIHPQGADWITTIANGPSWMSQSQANTNIIGTAPEVVGDNVNFPSDTYTVDIVRTNNYSSSTGTLTVVVNNLTAPVTLPGTVHTGSVVPGNTTNSDGDIYTGSSNLSGQFVMDLEFALEDGDKYEWYHQEQYLGVGIVSSGVDKTSDILATNSAPGSRWDLLAPFTGVPSNTQGQNFGNVYGMVGLVPVGWDDNTNPQAIPTRPVYNTSDVWKLYNNSGTIELYLNDVLFRSSSSTYTDPVITFATPAGISNTFLPLPSFNHTANAATVPSGFTLLQGNMDTATELNGDSAVVLDNLSLSPGQRLIIPKTFANSNILPVLDGSSGVDNKAFIGIPKLGVNWSSIDLQQDFYAVHRWENNTVNTTGMTMYHAGPLPAMQTVNHASDTDSNFHMAIEFTREGNLAIMRATDATASLTTEPLIGGSFATTPAIWSNASSIIGTSAQDIVMATKGAEAGITLTTSGLSIITAPLAANQFIVTEDTNSLPLFSLSAAGDITLNAGQTYKFWMDDSSIESTDALGFCLVSDSSDYTTGITMVGTPGTVGAYLEFVIPSDVPPIKVNWTSGGNKNHNVGTPTIAGSTYTASVTGVTPEGPSANFTGTVIDTGTVGWLSIDDTLTAGQRIVFDSAFITDLHASMPDYSMVFIGFKSSTWSNTASPMGAFQGLAGIRFYKSSASVGQGGISILGYANNSTTSQQYTLSLTNAQAFIEVTSSGNNVRVGHHIGSTSESASTTPYGDWSNQKVQTGNQGYGLTTVEPVVYWDAINGNTTGWDYSDVDWTGLSEIAVPAASTILTDWTKAVDFSGGSEHLKQVHNSASVNPLRMTGIGQLAAANSTPGYTSNATYSRPWACACVFRADGNSSNQHIWNSGEGAGSGDDNIYLRYSSTGQLYFGWGRSGATNECAIGSIQANKWYGIYIGHTGARLSSSQATSSNLGDIFDIRITNEIYNWQSATYNYAQLYWSDTGARMDRTVGGDFTIGGRGGNRNFHGKVASMVTTTLRRNQPMPTTAEIDMMITDPKKWVTDYKNGNIFRYGSSASEATFRATGRGNTENFATQVWLMGEESLDSYGNGIRNHIFPTDQNYTKLQFNSMTNNDIETVNISGLT